MIKFISLVANNRPALEVGHTEQVQAGCTPVRVLLVLDNCLPAVAGGRENTCVASVTSSVTFVCMNVPVYIQPHPPTLTHHDAHVEVRGQLG